MAKVLLTKFQLHRGYESAWEKNNPILASGEPGFVIDKNYIKIGDGIKTWKELDRISGDGGNGGNGGKDEVYNAPTYYDFPLVGSEEVIYKAEQERKIYQWNKEALRYDVLSEVEIPAQAEYSITKAATSDYAATYYLTKDGVNVGAAINIPKDMIVESGEVKELEAGVWGEAGTYIVITLANATDDKLYINASSLIEYVTSGSAADDMVVINVDSQTHKVRASVTNGSITEAKLHSDVTTKLNKVWEEVGVAKGLVDALAGEGNTSTVKANADAITDITKDGGVIDQKITELQQVVAQKSQVQIIRWEADD